jgi:RNA polymerase sigma-70 factor (ECF subfamily)
MLETLEDKILIQQYLKGNEQSLEELVGRYLKPIYSFVYKNVGDQAAAEDVSQEVFVKIWKNLKKFDQKKNFKPWLFQIAKNTSIDYLRKRKTIPFSRFENEKGQNTLTESIAAKTPDIIGDLSDKKILVAAMQGLDNKEQKLINMRHNDGMSFKEIADIFDESINTVKSRYRRALLVLRKNIKHQ